MTPPLEDPNHIYEQTPPCDVVNDGQFPVIDYKKFQVPPSGLSEEEREDALNDFKEFIEMQHQNFAGFQGNQDQNYAGKFPYLLDMHANNIGDPFSSGRYTLNSKFCERAVLDWFAALWNIEWPHDGANLDSYWGYVLTMGFTEGNIYAVYNARDYLKGRLLLTEEQSEKEVDNYVSRGKEVRDRKHCFLEPLFDCEAGDPIHYYTPVLFYSEDVHYSVTKAGRMVNVDTFSEIGRREYPGQCPINNGDWPEAVPSHNYDNNNPKSGSVIVEDLEKLVEFFVEKDYPVIIVANIGTTWKGAYDDVPAIDSMLKKLGEKYPWLWDRPVKYAVNGENAEDRRRGFWLMVDGALGGPFVPFLQMAINKGEIEDNFEGYPPIFDFRNDAVMSVGCSMHKWLGAPWPGGVFLTRTRYQLLPPDEADNFLGTPDTTLGGSRSAFSPMIFWDYISRMNYDENIKKAVHNLKMAELLEEEMRALESELKEQFQQEGSDDCSDEVNLWIARSRLSLTVRFRLVNESLNYKYSLDTDRYIVPLDDSLTTTEERSYSHLFAMDSLTPEIIKNFICDIRDCIKDGNDWHNAFPRVDESICKPNPSKKASIQKDHQDQRRGLLPFKKRWGRKS